jgi:hypothetical protein
MMYSISRPQRLSALVLAGLLIQAEGARVCTAVEPLKPGLNDLVVYDPGMHERGLPSPQLRPTPEGNFTVETPPAVHLHRYYYSGDKEFQGPLINGGPTMIVARHPKSGDNMYVDVVLPPGAPVVAYNSKSITYVYPDQRVEVEFSHFIFNDDKVVVHYCSGRGIGRVTRDVVTCAATKCHSRVSQSAFIQAAADVGSCGKSFAVGTAASVGDCTANTLKAAGSLAKSLPGVVMLQSKYDERFQRRYEASIDQATRKRLTDVELRTNR